MLTSRPTLIGPRLRGGLLALLVATAGIGAGLLPALADTPPAAAEPAAPSPPAAAEPSGSNAGGDAPQGSETEAQPAPPAGCPVRTLRKLELIV